MLAPDAMADMAVLSDDYMRCDEGKIKDLESVLTVVNGRIGYGTEGSAPLAPEPPPVSPDWSPVREFGGYGAPRYAARARTGNPSRVSPARSRGGVEMAGGGEPVRAVLAKHARCALDGGCSCFAF